MPSNGALAVIGASGHGREVIQAIQRSGGLIHAVYDDNEHSRPLIEKLGLHFGGTVARCAEPAIIGIGSGAIRARLDRVLRSANPVVDPLALVGSDVIIGDGSVFFAMATVTTNISIGRHVHIGRGAAVGHDSVIGDYVSVMPLASISGNVVIEPESFIGTGALVRQGVRVGRRATVGMGAVVTKDVQAGSTVIGNPARVLK